MPTTPTNTNPTTTTAPATGHGPEKFVEIFYRLPGRDLTVGMSTDDGQDILKVSEPDEDGWVWATVYTPRSDDPEQDEFNRCDTVVRGYRAEDMVDLAVFSDTEVNGSTLPRAVPA
jgi:hypothetical protein